MGGPLHVLVLIILPASDTASFSVVCVFRPCIFCTLYMHTWMATGRASPAPSHWVFEALRAGIFHVAAHPALSSAPCIISSCGVCSRPGVKPPPPHPQRVPQFRTRTRRTLRCWFTLRTIPRVSRSPTNCLSPPPPSHKLPFSVSRARTSPTRVFANHRPNFSPMAPSPSRARTIRNGLATNAHSCPTSHSWNAAPASAGISCTATQHSGSCSSAVGCAVSPCLYYTYHVAT